MFKLNTAYSTYKMVWVHIDKLPNNSSQNNFTNVTFSKKKIKLKNFKCF